MDVPVGCPCSRALQRQRSAQLRIDAERDEARRVQEEVGAMQLLHVSL